MGEYSEAFVAFDVAKRKHAVAIAEGGRKGEVRFLGEIENSTATIERVIKRLAGRYDRLHVCFEAGPTGYELYRRHCQVNGVWRSDGSEARLPE
jgi:transposase